MIAAKFRFFITIFVFSAYENIKWPLFYPREKNVHGKCVSGPTIHLRGPWVQILQQKWGDKLRNQKAGNGLPTIIYRRRNAPRCLSTFCNAFLLRVRWLRMNCIEHGGQAPRSGRIENLFYIDFNIYLIIKNCLNIFSEIQKRQALSNSIKTI